MQLKHLTTEWHQFFLPLLVLAQGQAQVLVQVQALEVALKQGLELKKELANSRAQAYFFFFTKKWIFSWEKNCTWFVAQATNYLTDTYGINHHSRSMMQLLFSIVRIIVSSFHPIFFLWNHRPLLSLPSFFFTSFALWQNIRNRDSN